MDPAKLHELMLSLQKGEKSAFIEIYHDFFLVMYNLSVQYLYNDKVAEEIVQDTFYETLGDPCLFKRPV